MFLFTFQRAPVRLAVALPYDYSIAPTKHIAIGFGKKVYESVFIGF